MPLFICDECDTIENTSLGHYWARDLKMFDDESKNGKALCSACTPPFYVSGRPSRHGGRWHNMFSREIATEEALLRSGVAQFEYLGKFSYLKESRG